MRCCDSVGSGQAADRSAGSDNTAQYDVVLTALTTHQHRMELDTQQADLMLQLRQMNITDNRRAAQSYPGPLQRGSDSGFSSDKVRN